MSRKMVKQFQNCFGSNITLLHVKGVQGWMQKFTLRGGLGVATPFH